MPSVSLVEWRPLLVLDVSEGFPVLNWARGESRSRAVPASLFAEPPPLGIRRRIEPVSLEQRDQSLARRRLQARQCPPDLDLVLTGRVFGQGREGGLAPDLELPRVDDLLQIGRALHVASRDLVSILPPPLGSRDLIPPLWRKQGTFSLKSSANSSGARSSRPSSDRRSMTMF